MHVPEILDEIDAGVIFHDPETAAVVDVNERMTPMYGYTAEQFRSMDVADFSAASSDYSQAEAERRIRAAAAGDPQTFEWHARKADGELLWVRVRLSRVTVEGEAYVMAEIRDITDYKRRERRLRLLHRVLRHNLRNDMTVVLGHADALEAALEDDDLERQAAVIERTAEDMARLSDSVRQIERITARDEDDRHREPLAPLLEQYVANLREQFPDVDLTADLAAEAWVHVDRGLEVALEHLVENAVEHHDDGTPSVRVTATAAAGHVEVTVTDDGPGIPQVEIDALDRPEATTSVAHGQGLGLWVAKWCVESLGGELLFGSEAGGGAAVTLRLPAVDGPADH